MTVDGVYLPSPRLDVLTQLRALAQRVKCPPDKLRLFTMRRHRDQELGGLLYGFDEEHALVQIARAWAQGWDVEVLFVSETTLDREPTPTAQRPESKPKRQRTPRLKARDLTRSAMRELIES